LHTDFTSVSLERGQGCFVSGEFKFAKELSKFLSVFEGTECIGLQVFRGRCKGQGIHRGDTANALCTHRCKQNRVPVKEGHHCGMCRQMWASKQIQLIISLSMKATSVHIG